MSFTFSIIYKSIRATFETSVERKVTPARSLRQSSRRSIFRRSRLARFDKMAVAPLSDTRDAIVPYFASTPNTLARRYSRSDVRLCTKTLEARLRLSETVSNLDRYPIPHCNVDVRLENTIQCISDFGFVNMSVKRESRDIEI